MKKNKTEQPENDDFDLSPLKEKLKKKRINSRKKGNTFELKICKILNEKFNTTEFCRSPGSGAFATTHKLPEYMKIQGDIITPKDFKFTLECKKGYNKLGLDSFLNTKSDFYSMIAQATKDYKNSSKNNWAILIQQDRQEILFISEIDIKNHSHSFDRIEISILNTKPIYIYRLSDILKLDRSFFFIY
jgi:hypothetical protein